MKQTGYIYIILASVFIVLLVSHSASARILQENSNQAGAGSTTSSMATVEDDDNIATLMGSEEECRGNDEDCVNRRMIADAHLDYIYTQRHKPTKAKASP